MSLPVLERRSPNHGPRPDGLPVDILLLHYTDMATAEAAVDRLCDPDAKVSAHYVVAEDGRIWRLVDEDRRAWHAGVAWWAGESDVNGRSIGIELANPGHSRGYRQFPEAQVEALVGLARGILARHPIPASRVLGHSDVSPGRKIDPGHLFDWRRLAAAGIGLFPEAGTAAAEPAAMTAALAAIGYRTGAPDPTDPATLAALHAFQRHWMPDRIGQAPGPDMAGMLRSVADAVEKIAKPIDIPMRNP